MAPITNNKRSLKSNPMRLDGDVKKLEADVETLEKMYGEGDSAVVSAKEILKAEKIALVEKIVGHPIEKDY